MLKVSRLIQKELGNMFVAKKQEICLGLMVTVTNVRLSPDLAVAKVYLSVYPSGHNKNVLQQIKMHTKQIRNELGHEVKNQLRIVPELDFFIDDSLEYIHRIDELLKKIN